MTTPPFPMTRTRTCLQPSSKLNLLSWAIALGLNAPTLMAEGSGQAFNIPAQPLSSALNAYADAANVQLSYPAVLADGIKSPGVSGQHTPEQALRKLLGGSLIVARTTANGTVTLEKVTQSTPVAPSSGQSTLPTVKVSGQAEYDETDPRNSAYNRTNASTATKTDTPLMETPVNIQVIPKAVLDDQQTIQMTQALKNVAGATVSSGSGGLSDDIFLRGFRTSTYFRNGFRIDSQFASIGTRQMANVERLEVIKGPAAILYGRMEPGGMVNVVTKQPLATPYYALQQQFGSYDLYRTTVDATGPVATNKNLLYRFNASFEDSGSFREFVDNELTFLAPTLTWNISDRTQATLELEYRHDNLSYDTGAWPFVNGQFIAMPRSRNLMAMFALIVEKVRNPP